MFYFAFQCVFIIIILDFKPYPYQIYLDIMLLITVRTTY